MYVAESLQFGSLHTSFMKKRETSSSLMTICRHSKNTAKTSFGEGLKLAAESALILKDVIHVAPSASGAQQLKVKSNFQKLR